MATVAPDRDSEINPTDLLLLIDPNNIQGSLWNLRRAFRKVFWVTLATLVILVPVSLWINATEWRGLNLIFLFVLAAIGIYHAIDPFKWLTAFGIGTVTHGGFPNAQLGQMIRLNFPDFKLQEFMAAGGKGVKVFWDLLVVVWLFLAMWFSVLATFEVNSAAAYGFMATLLMAGAMSIKWPSANKTYKRICSAVTLLMMIIWGTLTFFGGGALESKIRAEVSTVSLSQINANHIVFSTKPTVLTDWVDANTNGKMEPAEREVVTVAEGCYTFSAVGTSTLLSHDPHGAYKDLGGGNLLINGRHFRRVIKLMEAGPVIVSFSPFPTTDTYPRVVDEAGKLSYEKIGVTINQTTCS